MIHFIYFKSCHFHHRRYISKRLCNNYLEGGGGGLENYRRGIGENDNKREEGLDVKFNTYRRGALLFHSFLQTGKVVEELLEFKYKY